MNRWIAMQLLVVLGAGMTLAQKPAASGNAVADQLRQIENDWTEAQKTKNVAKLGEILADEWLGIGPDGKTSDKTKALADLKSPGNVVESVEMGPMQVRIFGNTAVVTGSETEKSMDNGKDSSGRHIWTDVFVKQNGKWRAVASHDSKMVE